MINARQGSTHGLSEWIEDLRPSESAKDHVLRLPSRLPTAIPGFST